LSKHFDFVADNVDTTVVRCVEFEDAFTEIGAEEFVSETENTGGLTSTWWALYRENRKRYS
jgi:hypothetical protein